MFNTSTARIHKASSELSASSADEDFPQFIGVSSVRRRLLLQAQVAAPHLQIATIEGEPGTGKHLFAQILRRQSAVAQLPIGCFDAREWLANETDLQSLSGTIYLDRVDLLASIGQALLLSFVKMLQASTADRPGQGPGILLIASTQTSLRQLASNGTYLPDLAFRLSAARFLLPPLRDHREDIAPIVQALIDRICRRYRQPTAILGTGALSRLLQHSWPGNIREIASVLESAILESTTGVLSPSDFQLDLPIQQTTQFESSQSTVPTGPTPYALDDLSLDAVIHRHIQFVLELNRGNKLRAARQLRISRSTLYRILAGESTLTS